MNDHETSAWWMRSYTLSPGMGTLLGVAMGCALAIVDPFSPLPFFPFGLLLMSGLFGGIFGYTFWLSCDPVRSDRFHRITGYVAWMAILGLSLGFPGLWRHMGPLTVTILWGGIAATAFFAVGAVYGMAHLVGNLASSFRQSTKPGADLPTEGVWDRELDQSGSPIR